MGRIFLIITLFLLSQNASSNSCCGQSPTSFPVLALNQKVSINTSVSAIQSQGRIFNSDQFYEWNDKKRQVQAFQLNWAGTVSDHQQYYINTSLLRGEYTDTYENQHSEHLSDTQLGYTFEVLPEYSFSYWRPVVYLSLLANLPTGKSIYDNTSISEGTDVTGHNQWGTGVGITLRKVYFPLTLTFQTRTLHMFSKVFDGLKVSNFYDTSWALISNYTTPFQQVSINLGITTQYLSARKISGGYKSESVQNATVLIGLQKTFTDSWTAGINYSDQTWVGPAKNSILNRTITMNLNYNYF